MKLLLIVAAVTCLALFTVSATQAKGPGGNSPNAKACQKGGWDSLYQADGSTFANEQACVAWGAKGNTLYTRATLCALFGGTLGTSELWSCVNLTATQAAADALSRACTSDGGHVLPEVWLEGDTVTFVCYATPQNTP